MIVHPFAGIGWSTALRRFDLTDTGLELSPSVCATRRANRHTTIECDVAAYDTAEFTDVDGGIFGPPCPPFSRMGTGKGLHDLPHIHSAIDDLAAGRDTRTHHAARCLDDRSILTAEPMRWIHALRPRWILMEQVPSVLPVWDHYAEILKDRGYSVATAVRNCAGYGLLSNRPRAFFAASLDREITIPAYTHGGPGQPPLRTMSEIGWGYTQRPAPTVTSGGTSTGGAEPFGNGSRQAMRRAIGTKAWKPREGVDHLRPTLAEAMALNGLPADLIVEGNAGQKYTLVGNVVPPPAAEPWITAVTGLLPLTAPQQLELALTAA